MVARAVSEAWQGPLPPPASLRTFNEIVPGAAERILAVFEKQAEHRMRMETTVVTGRDRNMRRGQVFAFLVALSFLGGALYCAVLGYPTLAGVIAGSTLVSIVGAFLYCHVSERAERRERRAE
jgi:uncharacterized membrane protein